MICNGNVPRTSLFQVATKRLYTQHCRSVGRSVDRLFNCSNSFFHPPRAMGPNLKKTLKISNILILSASLSMRRSLAAVVSQRPCASVRRQRAIAMAHHESMGYQCTGCKRFTEAHLAIVPTYWSVGSVETPECAGKLEYQWAEVHFCPD